MSPPINIDGNSVSVITIDGQEVKEVTVDGQTAYTAIPDSGIYLFEIAEDNAGFRARNLSTRFDINTNSVFYTTNTDATSTFQNYVVDFKPDGSKVLLDNNNETKVVQYDLSEPFDIRTRSNPTTIDVGNEDVMGALIVNNGNTMYVSLRTTDKQLQYDLSTKWDISTASLDASFNLLNDANTITTNNDGTKGYVQRSVDGKIKRFSLSTPFDFTTQSQDYTDSTDGSTTFTIRFSPDGTRYFEFDRDNKINQFDLTTPFDTRSRTNKTRIPSFNDSGGGTINGFAGKLP